MKPTRLPTVLVVNPAADVYGSDLQVLQSISAMKSQGWEVVVASPRGGPLDALLREHGARPIRLPFPVLRRASISLRLFPSLCVEVTSSIVGMVRLLRRERPNLVYVNTVTLPWWLFAASLARVPAVCHVHEAEHRDSAPVRFALFAPLLFASLVIANSDTSRRAVTEVVPALSPRTHVVHNGIAGPPEGVKPHHRERRFRLVSVSRLSPRKAPHLTLEALALLRSEGRQVELLLCGTPFEGYEWYEAQLRDRAGQPDLAGAVTFLGYVSPVWPTLAEADAFVATSLGESFGNAVVEAQLAQRPVIVTAVPGHDETVEDGRTGLLVEGDNPRALAEAVARLMDDPDLAARLAHQGRSEALQRYSLRRYHERLLDSLHPLIRDRRR